MQISKKAIAVITLVAVALPLAGCANMQKTNKIAVVDYQTVLANHPDRKDAEKKLEDAYRDIQKQAMEKQNDSSISQEDKMQKMQEFQKQILTQEKNLIAPIKDDVDKKIDETMKEKGYTAVFSKQALVRGGDDITDEVLKKEGLSDDEISKAKDVAPDPAIAEN